MTYGAFGLVEVLGSANAVLVVDQMLKTSEVEFRTWDTKCGGHATVFMSGDIAAVTAAVQRVSEAPLCEVVASAVILGKASRKHVIGLRKRDAVRDTSKIRYQRQNYNL